VERIRIIMEEIKSCINCTHFYHSPAQWGQPYPEFTCMKEHWCGIGSQEEMDSLYDVIECEDFTSSNQ
jgi:hypothetical protein